MDTQNNSEFYDSVIAAKLLELAQLCQARQMSFVSSVEISPGETAELTYLAQDACFKSRLAYGAVAAHGNVDSLIIGLQKRARVHGHSSLCLKLLGVAERPEAVSTATEKSAGG